MSRSPAAAAQGEAASDTGVVVRGFLQHAADRWRIGLPEPAEILGVRTNELTIRRDAGRWSRLEGRYVEAGGRVSREAGSTGLVIALERVKEAEPAGTAHRTLELSLSQVALLTLSVVPNRVAWRLPDGRPSGVQPLLLYTIANHGQTPLEFELPTKDLLCVTVRDGNGGTWSRITEAPTLAPQRIVIQLGTVYRQVLAIPDRAAGGPGRYTARATLCGVPDYAMEAELEVR